MNMNRKLLLFLTFIVSIFFLNVKVYASSECTKYSTEKQCNNHSICKWNGSSCEEAYVADKPCDENSIRRVLQIFGYILLVAKVAIPLIIIGFGTFDLLKSVVDKDEKSFPKQLKRLLMRVVAGFIVFFVPNIIYAVFSLSESLNIIEDDQYKTCAACVLDPTNEATCKVED